MQIEIEFQADVSTVQQKIPVLYGTLTPTPTGVLLQEQYDDVEGMARYLMVPDLPFVIHYPPELREALLRLGERLVQIAAIPLSCRDLLHAWDLSLDVLPLCQRNPKIYTASLVDLAA